MAAVVSSGHLRLHSVGCAKGVYDVATLRALGLAALRKQGLQDLLHLVQLLNLLYGLAEAFL